MKRLGTAAMLAGLSVLGACAGPQPDKPPRDVTTRTENLPPAEPPMGRPAIPARSSAEVNAIDLRDPGALDGLDAIMER